MDWMRLYVNTHTVRYTEVCDRCCIPPPMDPPPAVNPAVMPLRPLNVTQLTLLGD